MKFETAVATSVNEIPAYLMDNKWHITAGGTIIRRMPDNGETIINLLDISEIESLKFIRVRDNKLEIGPLVTPAELCESAVIAEHCPALAQAATLIGNQAVRESGTIGGNIGSGSSAADLLPPLVAAKAGLTLKVDADHSDMMIEKVLDRRGGSALKSGQLITRINVPLPVYRWAEGYRKAGERDALSISICSAAVRLNLDDDSRIAAIRIAIGSCAPAVVRARAVEKALKDQVADEHMIRAAAGLIVKDIAPVSDSQASADQRSSVLQNLLADLIIDCVDIAKNREIEFVDSTDYGDESEF